jgi:SAM-dependent methyltransferase
MRARNLLGRIVPHSLKIVLRNFFLRGTSVQCPICNRSFVTFLPFGEPPRANAICPNPNCGSLERTRMYWLYLTGKDGFFTNKKRLLHVAPERGLFKRFMESAAIEYFPVDKFSKGYVYPAGTRSMDVCDLKFEDGYFDYIICSHVLEHVPDDRKGMSELFRVLKKGGEGIIQVPMDTSKEKTFEDPTVTDPAMRAKLFGETDHLRMYGRDYADRLASVGFEVNPDDFVFDLDKHTRFRNGLIQESLYVVRKP